MNRLKGHIVGFDARKGVHLVVIECGGVRIHAVTLELKKNFMIGSLVNALFKETEVILADVIKATVFAENVITGIVTRATVGDVFTEVLLECDGGTFAAVMTNASVPRTLRIAEGACYSAIIPSSSVSIEERSE